MSDPEFTSPCWLDVPLGDASPPPTDALPPDIQTSLARVAEAIAAVRGPQLRSLARYLAGAPGRGRFEGLTRRLPERSLIDFLRNMTDAGRAPSSAALPPLETLARETILRRVLDEGRITALQRACDVVSGSTQGGQTA
jgi:hypothetical protein